MQQGFDSDVLDVAADEFAIFNVIVHIVVHILRGFTIVNQAITDLVEELHSGNLDAV